MLNAHEFLNKIEEFEELKHSFEKFLTSNYSIFNYNLWKKLNLLIQMKLKNEQLKIEMSNISNKHLEEESSEEVKQKKIHFYLG